MGFGAFGEIRREAVTDWLDENKITDGPERSLFRQMITLLDHEELASMRDKDKATAPNELKG